MSRVVLAACAVLLLLAEAHAQSDWKKEWEKTIEAAKKEGQVNVYIGGWETVLESGAFQKAYPEIKVTWVGGRAGETAKRILAERRAGKFIADVSSEGIGTNYRSLHAAKSFDPIKPALLLPEVTNESLWYQGRHRYIDPEGQFVFRYVGTQQKGNISYNSKLVNPKEIHSVWDLVDARWKGKIIARDVRSPGPGNAPMRFFYHHPAIGPTFIKKLFGEMDVTLFRDFRQSIDWLASGKASLCFFCSDIDKAKLQGLPVNEFATFTEGAALHTQYGTLALLNRAPHANAAKVFINWFLSRDGQIALQKSVATSSADAPDSLRIDIPKDDVKPENRRAARVDYLDLDSEVEWTEMKPVLAIFEEALGMAEKKRNNSMTRVLRLGVAGLGNAGQAALRDLGAAPGIALAAVADTRSEALDSFHDKNPAIKTFDSVESMCASDAVDAVWIATPNEFHAAHAVAAAVSGKHVVCEKPMAVSLAECDAMIEAAARSKITLLMHSKAGDPPVVQMRELVASGRLGRPIQINSWNYKGWLKSARLPSEVDTSKGGGVVFRQGAHQIDIVRAILGKKITSVRAVTGRWHPRFHTEGNYTALLEFEDGTPATLVFNGYGGFDVGELTWGIGESGYLSSKETEETEARGPVGRAEKYAGSTRAEKRKRRGERRQPFFGLTLVSCERGDIRQSPDGLYVYTERGREEIFCPPFLDRAGDLIRLREAVTQNRAALADGPWGKATLEIVLAILQSSKERREILLKHHNST